MDEQVIDDLYSRAKSQGYTKSRNEFIQLIQSDKDVFNDMYSYVKSKGYQKDENSFSSLIGKTPAVTQAPAAPAMPTQAAPVVAQPAEEVKKKATALPVGVISSELLKQQQEPDIVKFGQGEKAMKPYVAPKNPILKITKEQEEQEKKTSEETGEKDETGFWGNLWTNFVSGVNDLDKMVYGLPEAAYNILAIPQNAIAYATGWDIATNADLFKKQTGISNPILDRLKKEGDELKQETQNFNLKNYQSSSVYDNIKNSNYGDAFKVLTNNIVQSAPVSIAMMMGGATLSAGELAAAGTVGFSEQNREELGKDNPNMSEIEKTIKSLGMAASETVFESVGTGTIGQVYRDIIKKEGVEAGTQIFKEGVNEMYKNALKKYGVPIGLIGEGTEEAATQITQNVISGKPAFEGVADAFITGAGSGVAFSAPITAINAKNQVKDIIQTQKSKNEINSILKNTDAEVVDQIFNVPKNTTITPEQVQIANVNNSRDILLKSLNKQVKDGTITNDDAKQSVYIFDKVQQVSNAVKDLKVTNQEKAEIANLLSKRNQLATDIQNKDDVLVVKEKQEIADINQQIQDIITSSKPETVAQLPAEIANLNDDEVKTFTVQNIEDIPEQFRDRAEKKEGMEIKLRKTILGIPIGKETTQIMGEGYNYSLTGKEIKDYAIQEQESNAGVLRSQQPQLGLQEVGEGNEKPQIPTTSTEETIIAPSTEEVNAALKDVESTTNALDADKIKKIEELANIDADPNNLNEGTTPAQYVASLYHLSKADGSNPELVKAVEDLLGKPTPTETVSSKTQEVTPAPRLARDIGLLITPATVRGYDKFTKRIKKMSLQYDKLVKEFNETKDPKTAKELKKLESQILDAAKKDILEDLSKIDGVAVRFRDAKRGLWRGAFEPSFNMELVISPQADTQKISELLSNFAEKYSQDSFILETNSEYNDAVMSGQRAMPLTEFDENGLTHYPQIIYTFDTPITDEQVAALSVKLQKNGIDAFNINNDELKVSVMKFFPEKTPLTENEQYAERKQHFENTADSVTTAASDVLGSNANVTAAITIKKSHYEGAINEDSPEQTRKYNRSNFLEAFQKGTTRVEGLAAELAKLREKQIELQNRGEQLSPQDKERFDKLNAEVQPIVQATFEANKKLYEDSKVEVEGIAARAIKGLKASLSPFFIKRPERASVKTIRWYGSFTEKLGDGSRVNVVVDTIEDADKVYAEIEKQHPKDADIRRVNETTDLGYPKRLIEVRTSNGTISEIQVITKEAYLAKDGVKGFTGGNAQVKAAKQKLKEIRANLGWNIPDGLGHYFYEINRDVNVDKSLRDEAQRLSLLYYDAFINPDSKLTESYMDDVIKFKEQVDAADKSDWDKGNEGKVPEPLADYISQTIISAPQGLSEAELPGYDRMKSEVEGIISKSEKRGVDKAKTMDNVMQYVMKSKVYETATDIQREALVREVNKMFGVREKSGPSLSKLLNAVKDVAKITMTEKSLLVKQIKDLGRGAKDAVKASRLASEQLSKNIKELAASGKITPTQAANVLRAFSKVNVFSETSVRRFTDYMTKVFAKADYAESLKNAKSLKSDLLQLSKNQDKNANLRDLAAKFCEIDPSLVEDINAYNKIASEIKEATKGSTILGKKVKFAEIVNIENASKYIDDVMKAQRKTLLEYAAADFEDAMGVSADGLTYEDLMDLLDETKPTKKYNESIVRSAIQKMFDINSSIIKSMLDTKVDAFTGDPVSFTKSQQDIINRFMNMDLSQLSAKEALQAVDALGNFIQNKSTAKMEAVVSEYTGENNMRKVNQKGISAIQLRKYFSPFFGKLLAEQTTTLPALFERMFKGVNRGGFVSDMIGVTKLISNKAFAQREANNIVENYVKQFYNKKANGEDFNSQKNNVERGIASFMMRNIIGTEAEMKQEFQRRKNLIEESIDVLSEGTEQERAKAELYNEAFEKIVKDAKNIQDIRDKTDATNLEAVNFWTEQWANKYDELADVSLNVYNKVLGRDVNYNPDRFSRLSDDISTVEIKNNESQFHNGNDNGNIYKKENGVLMIANRPEKLPINDKTKRTSRYIDLSFDNNNANSMHDALIDIKTAAAIRQIDAATNSKEFKKIVPNAEDAKILKERINLYVQNIRNKNIYAGSDEMSKVIRKLNKVASIGVSQSLGGVTQPIKQVIPVAMNTLVNAGSLNMGAMFDPSKIKFILESGESIANRGVESQAQIDSLNKLIDEASKSKGDALVKKIEELNNFWLKTFLVKPDVFIARASWLTYYEKGLKKQGIETNGLDYDSHVKNEEAAAYATRMLDRQQNISDADLGGKLFTDKNESRQIFIKMLMPFASFRLNQSTRLANDLSTIGHWGTSTKEDKIIAARSLAGFGVEMAVFKAVAAGSAILFSNAASYLMGRDEDDEEKKKRIGNIIKGQATGVVTDVFSPSPLLDKVVQSGARTMIDVVQDFMEIADEDKVNIYNVKKEDFIRNLGLFGIAADRANQLASLIYLSATGKFKDDYGKDKYLNEKDRDALKYLIVPALMSSTGLAPSEVNTVIRNAMSNSKKDASSKVGGKSEEDLRFDKETKELSKEKKEKIQESRDEKVDALRKMLKVTNDKKKRQEINDLIDEYSMTDEERKASREERKFEIREEKLQMEELLDGYDNKEQLKKYNPSLYERNFGEGSKYYKEHRVENEVEKALNKKLKIEEDRKQRFKNKAKIW